MIIKGNENEDKETIFDFIFQRVGRSCANFILFYFLEYVDII